MPRLRPGAARGGGHEVRGGACCPTGQATCGVPARSATRHAARGRRGVGPHQGPSMLATAANAATGGAAPWVRNASASGGRAAHPDGGRSGRARPRTHPAPHGSRGRGEPMALRAVPRESGSRVHGGRFPCRRGEPWRGFTATQRTIRNGRPAHNTVCRGGFCHGVSPGPVGGGGGGGSVGLRRVLAPAGDGSVCGRGAGRGPTRSPVASRRRHVSCHPSTSGWRR